jgi:hypothetical protein
MFNKSVNVKNCIFKMLLFGLCLFFIQITFAQESKLDPEKYTTFTGRVFRSDTNVGIPNVRLSLIDEKKSKRQNNSVSSRTDENGNFRFDFVIPGKYTIGIGAFFDKKDDVPCKFIKGKSEEPNSKITVYAENDKWMELVFIKKIEFKAGMRVTKEYNLVCKNPS